MLDTSLGTCRSHAVKVSHLSVVAPESSGAKLHLQRFCSRGS